MNKRHAQASAMDNTEFSLGTVGVNSCFKTQSDEMFENIIAFSPLWKK